MVFSRFPVSLNRPSFFFVGAALETRSLFLETGESVNAGVPPQFLPHPFFLRSFLPVAPGGLALCATITFVRNSSFLRHLLLPPLFWHKYLRYVFY